LLLATGRIKQATTKKSHTKSSKRLSQTTTKRNDRKRESEKDFGVDGGGETRGGLTRRVGAHLRARVLFSLLVVVVGCDDAIGCWLWN
jgi:hypothetical protein